MRLNRYTIAPISALVCIAGAAIVLAGPLDPPAGTIAPTYKTLADVEPRIAISQATTPGNDQYLFRITQPGSYYLTSNIRVDSISYGIEIAASSVTIDLNGFTIYGGTEPGSSGIYSSQNLLRGITIRNGEFSNFEDSGINLATFPVVDGVIEHVKCRSNRGHGVWVGNSFRITGCSAISNNGDGFRTGRNTTITECTATGNLGDSGISVDDGSVVASCIANTNQNFGFTLGNGVTIDRSAAFANIRGMTTGENAVVTACTIYDNRYEGIVAASGSSITACTARSNGAIGIDVAAECTVSGCTSTFNGNHGIAGRDNSQIVGNTCTRNGVTATGTGAGIFVNGSASRIDSNHVSSNDYGIRTTTADTLVVRNTARDNTNTNYSFGVPTESAQIITNPGANFVAANPWANFSY
jgi:parallel beta-helix repeat protein